MVDSKKVPSVESCKMSKPFDYRLIGRIKNLIMYVKDCNDVQLRGVFFFRHSLNNMTLQNAAANHLGSVFCMCSVCFYFYFKQMDNRHIFSPFWSFVSTYYLGISL